ADSALLEKAAMPADAKHAVQAAALGSRVGIPLRAGAGVAERAHVVLADGMTSEHLAQRLAAESDVEYAVPDYRRRNTSAPSDPVIGNDGDGRDADASDAGDWVTLDEVQPPGPLHDCVTSAQDSSWHGTQTSSLIAALTDNGIGMASVGRGVRVLPVRVLGKC